MIDPTRSAVPTGMFERPKLHRPKHDHQDRSPFDTLLERDMRQSQRFAQRSYAFAETGMFGAGRHCAEQAIDADLSADGVQPNGEVRPAHPEPAAVDGGDAPKLSWGSHCPELNAALRVILSARADPGSGNDIESYLAIGQVGTVEASTTAEPENVAETGHVPVSRSTTSNLPAPRITVAGSDQALNVSVGAHAGDDIELQKLRESFDEIAAEFGMKIATFKFNGSGTERPGMLSGRD